ncbi:MAG: orotate phosphoribosyltransferase [Flavobacteriales bacterium]|nr:orotate phosphoribosyltransferase [Flavobacteriales bacterium]|tara:strand:- start:9166 stop:9783 length:618 start_codon:yes stop_codon:yes gene_type:complete
MILNIKDSEKVAKILLKINAVKLQPSNFFTWSSGKKSPIYCDNRLILSHVHEREFIVKLFCNQIINNFKSIDYIAGVATGAIAHGMLIASKLNLPFIYVRDSAKSHGRQNQIEGNLKKGSNVIVIEDLISTGKSSLKAIEAIEQSESKVIGLGSIFTYEIFNKDYLNVPCFSLCNYSTLINVAIDNNLINEDEKNILSNWQNSNH